MKPYTKSGPVPKKPPRRFSPPGPPLPPYLPMRFVRWEQYYDIWPNEEGGPFPVDNSEYPHPSPGWASDRDEQFYYWLLAKNVEPEWFHQDSCRKVKEELLNEFSQQWLEEGDYPSPRRVLWVKNYGGHRDMFYNTQRVNRLVEYIKHCIGWLRRFPWIPIQVTYEPLFIDEDGYINIAKPKRKTNDERMATFSDLFEDYEDDDKPKRDTG